ncbi:carbon-nitrogen hydrolase family protein [Amycolatopsis sulphurea]|uniref:carbon-nitrogen hydrolase family protein n=1 Tax=Amycolatopsis sulphurea TaxID=76022 RepID=UPI00147334B5|nr:carbon-nitrogen hydrolase family protein [Amycolatopsis sulphurea]
MNELTIGCVQFRPIEGDKAGTVKLALSLIDRAAARGAQLIVLPEVWTGTGLATYEKGDFSDIAEPVEGPSVQVLQERARHLGVYIVGSSFTLIDGRYHNIAPVIGPDGIVGSYSKTHLCDAPGRADIPKPFMESDNIVPGSDLPVFETDFGPLGISICADLRWPEVYRVLALKGARIILCVTGFLSPRLDHWEFLLRARATENQVFVVGSGMTGIDPTSGVSFVGRSMIVDPWGVPVAIASDGEGIVTTTIDLDLVDQVREAFPLLTKRRPELYGAMVEEGLPR